MKRCEPREHELVERHTDNVALVRGKDHDGLVADRICDRAEALAFAHTLAQLNARQQNAAMIRAHPGRIVIGWFGGTLQTAFFVHFHRIEQREQCLDRMVCRVDLETQRLAGFERRRRDPHIRRGSA